MRTSPTSVRKLHSNSHRRYAVNELRMECGRTIATFSPTRVSGVPVNGWLHPPLLRCIYPHPHEVWGFVPSRKQRALNCQHDTTTLLLLLFSAVVIQPEGSHPRVSMGYLPFHGPCRNVDVGDLGWAQSFKFFFSPVQTGQSQLIPWCRFENGIYLK